MLKTPVITPFVPINATQTNTIKFSYTGSNQVVKNNLVIEDLGGNTIYNQTQNTFLFLHNLPVNTLINGNSYRAKIRVADISNTWSSFSDSVIFYTLSSPTLSVLSIDGQGKVYNQTVNFQTSYTHPDNEPLQSYQYKLYDNNQNLLTSYQVRYSNGSTTLDEEISGLNNSTIYYIEVSVVTVKGQLATTGKVQFSPYYAVPKMTSGIRVENLKEQGAVEVHLSGKQVVLKLYDSNVEIVPTELIEYKDNDKIDLTNLNGKDYFMIEAKENFEINQDDFVLQVWIENLIKTDNEYFMAISSDTGHLRFFYYDNKFHCFKLNYNNSLISHFASNNIILSGQTTLLIKCINGLIELEAQNVS